jgi:hypothetical protein
MAIPIPKTTSKSDLTDIADNAQYNIGLMLIAANSPLRSIPKNAAEFLLREDVASA